VPSRGRRQSRFADNIIYKPLTTITPSRARCLALSAERCRGGGRSSRFPCRARASQLSRSARRRRFSRLVLYVTPVCGFRSSLWCAACIRVDFSQPQNKETNATTLAAMAESSDDEPDLKFKKGKRAREIARRRRRRRRLGPAVLSARCRWTITVGGAGRFPPGPRRALRIDLFHSQGRISKHHPRRGPIPKTCMVVHSTNFILSNLKRL